MQYKSKWNGSIDHAYLGISHLLLEHPKNKDHVFCGCVSTFEFQQFIGAFSFYLSKKINPDIWSDRIETIARKMQLE
jgi:hypothetical protein